MEGAVRSTIGNAYLELGLLPQAAEQLSRAQRSPGAGRRPWEDVIFARNRAIWADAMRGKPVSDRADRAFKHSEERLGREHPETVYAADTLAHATRGQPSGDDPPPRESRNPAPPVRESNTSSPCARPASLSSRLCYSQTDADLDEAESLARESCEQWVRRYGPEFPETLSPSRYGEKSWRPAGNWRRPDPSSPRSRTP